MLFSVYFRSRFKMFVVIITFYIQMAMLLHFLQFFRDIYQNELISVIITFIKVQKQKQSYMQVNPDITKQSLCKLLQSFLQRNLSRYVFQLSSKIYPVMISHTDCNQALFGSIEQYLKSTKSKNLSVKDVQNHVYVLAQQINSQLLIAIKQIIKANFFTKIDQFLFKDKSQPKKSPLFGSNIDKGQYQGQQLGEILYHQIYPTNNFNLNLNHNSFYSSSDQDEQLIQIMNLKKQNQTNLKPNNDTDKSIELNGEQKIQQKQQIKQKSSQKINNKNLIKDFSDPLSSARPPFNINNHSNQGSVEQKIIKKQQKKQQKIGPVQKYVLDDSKIYNFALQPLQLCICGKQCKQIMKNESTFKCCHCDNFYHTLCMKKEKQSKNCIFCNLKLIIPTKKVHKVLFQGVLKKNKRKHEITFNLSAQDVQNLRNKQQNGFRITVRCFRLKQNTQSFILFPDSAYISLNSKQLKQFRALHRQSSLKYRKDQPINITKNYSEKNKMIITQTPAASSSSDRVQFQNHFLGIYIIQEMSIQLTVKSTIKNYTNSFNQSLNLLQTAFGIGIITEDVSCQVVKIPLTCALTTEKITYPARGIFCRHFQCFDLKNFVMMISSSTNPRWICPLCKAPCYQFVYDCIVAQILKVYSDIGPKQVMFYKTGEFKVFNFKDEPVKNKIQSIYDLQIDSKYKRFAQDSDNDDEKKKKVKFSIPEGQEVIQILSD